MTREEAAEYFARKRDTLIWGLKDNRDETRQAHDAYNEAIAALCGPQPDPITGLVPCGCGGKAVFEGSFLDEEVPSSYRVSLSCIECGISTIAYEYEQEAMKDWNTAMGWKGMTYVGLELSENEMNYMGATKVALKVMKKELARERGWGCAYCVIGRRSPDAEYCSNCGRKLTPALPELANESEEVNPDSHQYVDNDSTNRRKSVKQKCRNLHSETAEICTLRCDYCGKYAKESDLATEYTKDKYLICRRCKENA